MTNTVTRRRGNPFTSDSPLREHKTVMHHPLDPAPTMLNMSGSFTFCCHSGLACIFLGTFSHTCTSFNLWWIRTLLWRTTGRLWINAQPRTSINAVNHDDMKRSSMVWKQCPIGDSRSKISFSFLKQLPTLLRSQVFSEALNHYSCWG